jgi:hypothetical protein
MQQSTEKYGSRKHRNIMAGGGTYDIEFILMLHALRSTHSVVRYARIANEVPTAH